jgi:hypothetical protein
VHTLVFWRCAAFFLFLVAVFDRLRVSAGGEPLAREGRAMWSALRAVPGVDVPLKPVEALGAWIDRIVGNLGWSFEPRGMAIVALVGFAVLMGFGYLLAGLFFYRAWDTRETNDVAQPPGKRIPYERRDSAVRIVAGLLYVALPALAIAYWR